MEPYIMNSPQSLYQSNFDTYSRECITVQSRINLISNLRLIVVVVTVILLIVLYRVNYFAGMGIALIGGIGLFIVLAMRHSRLFTQLDTCRALIAINNQGMRLIIVLIISLSGVSYFSDADLQI